MQRERFYKGKGRGSRGGSGSGGGGGGGRGNGNGGGGRGRGGRRRNSRGGGGRGRGGFQRGGAESGNQRERIAVESGFLVLIDQFMLANPQFTQKFLELIDADATAKDELIRDYGGSVVEVQPGTYRIERDPYAYSIIIHPEGSTVRPEDVSDRATDARGRVFVDTRCLAMIDRELLDDSSLLEKYQQLWFGGQDKACRDLLRDNGGAVRYGFQRYGDELGIYVVPGDDIVCLWPDVAEPALADDTQAPTAAA